MHNAQQRDERAVLPLMGAVFLALLLGDLLKLWLSPHLSLGLGWLVGTLFLGIFKNRLHLSWRHLILWSFGIAIFGFIFSAGREYFSNSLHLR